MGGSAVLFGLVVLARQVDFPKGQWTTIDQDWGWVIILLGIVGTLSPLYLANRLGVAQRELARRSQTDELCRKFVQAFERELKKDRTIRIPIESLSAAIWTVQWGWPGWRAVLSLRPTFRVLKRSGFWAQHGRIIRKQVHWTKGKSVIGKCWATAAFVPGDLTGLHALGTKAPTEFNAAPPAVRWNLTWDEYDSTKDYWAIFAQPLATKKQRFLGCLTIGCTEPDSGPAIDRAWKKVLVGGFAETAESYWWDPPT